MANGGFFNINGMGRIVTDVDVRQGKKNSYAKIELAEWPPDPDNDRKRGLIQISLKMQPEQQPPKKGDVIYIISGTYNRNPGTRDDGSTIYYHNLTAYVWRILPVGVQRTAASPASKPAPPDQPSAATPPPSLDEEDEDVPF